MLAQRRSMFDIPKWFVYHEKNMRFKIDHQQTLPVVREYFEQPKRRSAVFEVTGMYWLIIPVPL